MRNVSGTILLVLCALFGTSSLQAQNMILNDPVSARTFSSTKYVDINGSPFLSDKWIKGYAVTPKGTYRNLELKLDAYSNTLYFKKDEEPYEFQDEIISFVLTPVPGDSTLNRVFRKGLSGPNVRTDQYLQVLAEGKLSLYKAENKMLSETNEINKGIVKTFNSSSRYFIARDGQLQPVKLSKKELGSAFGDQQAKVEAYAKENGLSLSKEEDVKQVIKYYNSL